MLSIHQFKRLNLKQKLFAIDRKGVDLSVALFAEKETSTLYWLNNFYVEIVFEKGTQRIESVRGFTDTKRLNPYLDQINIGELTILLSTS